MIQKIIIGIWYLLPAIIGNMAPLFARIIFKHRFTTPVDFNMKFKGKPIFGSHKTYRGFVAGVICAVLTAYVQRYYYFRPSILRISLINYYEVNMLLWGFLMGFGALFGDLVKSFVKRRINVKAGKSWIPFDQIDFIFGALLFTFPIAFPPTDLVILMFVLGPFITLLVSRIGYWLKIRRSKC